MLHTPGHSPGCCCFRDAEQGVVFSGDTLFCGGPGATGRSYSDEPTILRSIRDTLLTLPDDTVVHTGHGESTTIGAERTRVLERANRARRLSSVRRNRITTIGIYGQNGQHVRPGTCCTAATWYVTSSSVKNVSWLASANKRLGLCSRQLCALLGVGETDRRVRRPRHDRRLDVERHGLEVNRGCLDEIRRRRVRLLGTELSLTGGGWKVGHRGNELRKVGAGRIRLGVEPEGVRLVAVRRAVDGDRDHRVGRIGDLVVARVLHFCQQAELVGLREHAPRCPVA